MTLEESEKRRGEVTLIEALLGVLVWVVLLIVCVGVLSYSEHKKWAEDPAKQVTKTVKSKLQVVEQRPGFDGHDVNNPYRSRAETVFYLYSTDGYKLEVKADTFVACQEGITTITSSRWKQP